MARETQCRKSSLVRYRRLDRHGCIRGNQFDGAVRADWGRGDRDLGPVADAQFSHDFADMDFHGRFGHAELATDDLVGVALAETNENGVLPLGKLGRVPRAVGADEAMAARPASHLVVEEGALLLVKAVLRRPEWRRLRLLFRPRKQLLLGKVGLSVFDGRRRAEGLAGQEGGWWKISAAMKDERKGLQRKVGRHGIAEITPGPATDCSENGSGIFIVGDDGKRRLTAKRMQNLYLG